MDICRVVSRDLGAGSLKFTSIDARVDGNFDDIPEDADHLENFYYRADLVAGVRAGKKTMASCPLRQVTRTDIVAWNIASWKSKIRISKNEVTSELFRQLRVPERMEQTSFKSADDHEACSLGEILLATIALIEAVNDEVVDSPQMDALLNRGRGLDQKQRKARMDTVRKAWLKKEMPMDEISQAILSVSLLASQPAPRVPELMGTLRHGSPSGDTPQATAGRGPRVSPQRYFDDQTTRRFVSAAYFSRVSRRREKSDLTEADWTCCLNRGNLSTNSRRWWSRRSRSPCPRL